MFLKIYRFIISRGSLPVLLTLLVACVVAVVEGSLSPGDIFLVFLVASLQSFLLVYEFLFDAAVPVERLTEENRLPDSDTVNAVAMGMSFIPLLLWGGAWLAWVALLAAGIYLSRSLWVLLMRLAGRGRLTTQALDELDAQQPAVAVYVSGLADVAYQVNQWLPVLERLDLPVMVVARQRGVFDGMAETDIPVFYARNMAHVETVLGYGVRTVLYPANTMHNVQALRQFQLNHFFINHGESDKAVNQSKLLQAYDKLLVAGPLAHRRLVGAGLALRDNQVEYVGRPQAELLLEQAGQQTHQGALRVLYAPTWEGFVDNVDYSSIGKLGLGLLKALSEDRNVEVVFKPHPYTGSRKSAKAAELAEMMSFCRANGIRVEESLVSIYECMNASDLLITDVSSVLNDYLITRKPVVMCVNEMMSVLPVDELFPSARAAYKLRLGESVGELISTIVQDDTMARLRQEVRADSLGDFPEGAMAKFKQVIRESVIDAVQ